jgi:hypothetical protein
VLHAYFWKSFSPCEESEPSLPPASQRWYSVGSITSTQPIIPECSVPQYSAQKMW